MKDNISTESYAITNTSSIILEGGEFSYGFKTRLGSLIFPTQETGCETITVGPGEPV